MKVYHGSYTAISLIDLSKCEKYKDFGQGFYVTRYRRQAEEWAGKIGQTPYTGSGENKTEASRLFFSSDTFTQLSDPSTGLYLKPWQEIYEMLKKELKA
ncbi:MAG: DUF3990 domain-containing protein [Dysgonamonadaceae bacterium]|jgi:hypothetical protein|nr:DUF3990 domain-containing protein [Dysgonamonadaceae bacterium]